jgi:hypothetical protein
MRLVTLRTTLRTRRGMTGLVALALAIPMTVSAQSSTSNKVPDAPEGPAQMSPDQRLAAQADPEGAWLGTVQIPRAVLADGQRLQAGSYRLRLTTETAKPVVGQTASSERWVEFMRDGKTVGRELAPYVKQAEVEAVTPPSSVPSRGGQRVQALRESEYLRIWFNHDGDQVLVYLPWADGPAAQPLSTPTAP